MSGGVLKSLMAGTVAAVGMAATGQEILREGDATYASYTPWMKARTVDANGKVVRHGDQSRFMQNRPLAIVDKKRFPLPTNDWWTHALVTEGDTGNLWPYPILARGTASGFAIKYPSYWIDNGTEMKAKTALVVSAKGTVPTKTGSVPSHLIADWHDWDVSFRCQDAFTVTLVHGSPLAWFVFDEGTVPVVSFDAPTGTDPSEEGTVPNTKVKYRLYSAESETYAVFTSGDCPHLLTVALVPDRKCLPLLAKFAMKPVTATKVNWKYDAARSTLVTTWTYDQPTLAGFLPHHYRRTKPKFDFVDGLTYATPHGKLKLAEGRSFTIEYPFMGIIPYWAAPRVGTAPSFDEKWMAETLEKYAERGTFGDDTYWGGKGLLQMGLCMMMAKELGLSDVYEEAKAKLKAVLIDWYTWTPGETKKFFSYIPRWGGIVGENTSYDSDTFNDHHFHYGYFTYASALLCFEDEDFKTRFGGMAKLLAKDYANWDRDETRFPLFRTFDPWGGHSFAGGVGDGNGNGQESSSEAMQGWAGLFLLGAALGDDAMRDAGVFGWVSEARGTAEYWFDRDRDNIDYTKYTKPYNSNYTCHGVGWWTYFSGDPVWMHSIQWMPHTPGLDYLSEDLKFAKWDFETMWKTKEITGWEKELGDASLGNVVLCYLERHDPKKAATIFEELRLANRGVAKNVDTGHITYYAIHSHLTTGDIDFSVRASSPLARTYVKDGKRTFVAYNPTDRETKVDFFAADGNVVGSVVAAPRGMSVSGRKSIPTPRNNRGEEKVSLIPPGVILSDLARGKTAVVSSEENVGTIAKHLTDGDEKTRWGSAHGDTTMTATIDLGEPVALYGIRLNWEASFAAKYVLETSKDGRSWAALGGERAGAQGEQKIELAGEKTRWVRMRALEKATQYGVSLWSFNVYGRPDSYKGSVPLGLRITAPLAVLKEGVETQLTAEGWFGGTRMGTVPVLWSSNGGKIDQNGKFTPVQSGSVPVCAEIGALRVERVFPVEESLKVQSFALEPHEVELAVGDEVKFRPEARDQFGGKMPIKGVKGKKPKLGTMKKGGVFVAEKKGQTTFEMTLGDQTAVANITVKDLSEIDLARKATVTASGYENDGLKAQNAIDGDPKTRWGSAHRDGEWIQLDLGKTYKISTVELDWENARAVDYDVLVSVDGQAWKAAAEQRGAKGGLEKHVFKPLSARYVKVLGIKRNTTYGISLFRFSVFARE